MKNYTKNILYQAYKVGAEELAEKILDNMYEQAKYHPTIFVFTKKIVGNHIVLDEVLNLLKHNLLGIKVTMSFVDQTKEDGAVIFTIDWS